MISRFFCALCRFSAPFRYIYSRFMYFYTVFAYPDTIFRMLFQIPDTMQSVSAANSSQEIPSSALFPAVMLAKYPIFINMQFYAYYFSKSLDKFPFW